MNKLLFILICFFISIEESDLLKKKPSIEAQLNASSGRVVHVLIREKYIIFITEKDGERCLEVQGNCEKPFTLIEKKLGKNIYTIPEPLFINKSFLFVFNRDKCVVINLKEKLKVKSISFDSEVLKTFDAGDSYFVLTLSGSLYRVDKKNHSVSLAYIFSPKQEKRADLFQVMSLSKKYFTCVDFHGNLYLFTNQKQPVLLSVLKGQDTDRYCVDKGKIFRLRNVNLDVLIQEISFVDSENKHSLKVDRVRRIKHSDEEDFFISNISFFKVVNKHILFISKIKDSEDDSLLVVPLAGNECLIDFIINLDFNVFSYQFNHNTLSMYSDSGEYTLMKFDFHNKAIYNIETSKHISLAGILNEENIFESSGSGVTVLSLNV